MLSNAEINGSFQVARQGLMAERRATSEEVESSMIPNPDHESKTRG